MNSSLLIAIPRKPRVIIPLLASLAGLLIWAMARFLPPAVDWNNFFRPAALMLLQGKSPYSVAGFPNPPWLLIPLLPLAVLPEAYGRAILELVSVCAIAYTAYQLGAKPLTTGLILISPPVLHGVLNGNVDGLALLGFVLPPQIGLFFLAIKPQIGVAGILFLAYKAWKVGGLREVIRVFWPVTVALLLSFVIFGFWPLVFTQKLSLGWNASLWPNSIPVGLVLLVVALRKKDIRFAMGSSPFLAPYILFHSWIVALVPLANSLPETLAAVVGLWILVILRAMGIA